MHYYPVWFDYGKWLFLAAGVLCGFAMMPEPASKKRGWLKLGFLSLIAIGLLFGATAGVIFNSRAIHLEATGPAFGVHFTSGRSSSTTWFSIPQPRGEFDLSIDGTHSEIEDGELVHVIYQDESYAVLSAEVLSGSQVGYHYTSDTNVLWAWLSVIAAVLIGAYGVLDWLNDGTAIPPPEDDTDAPDGDVDTKSMLHLSSDD